MNADDPPLRIGTAAWSIPRAVAASFPGEGTHLARYARVLNCAEINSSFYRHHRPEVYARWAAQTPPGFRFAVKLPRQVTHVQRLRAARAPLKRFLDEAAGLGDRLGVLLVQLPPSQPFEARPVRTFFGVLAELFDGPVVCEPRHASWFAPAADRLLTRHFFRSHAAQRPAPTHRRPGCPQPPRLPFLPPFPRSPSCPSKPFPNSSFMSCPTPTAPRSR
ncbi:DUF72 domain-containing protein [Xenophilus sp. Marseille-Q4582]|uniref:DUF72 domain-containing protein n=1 Tax=Xenophilus sp. Marseille-Q4582 TaxID=2866600 RepID=UPI001CE3E8F0|nr:DUF72 domain-containing protein [Xenophilus sp. Marseille-Q4582]